MSAEGQVIVEEERKGSRMGRTKPIKIRKNQDHANRSISYLEDSHQHFELNHQGASRMLRGRG